MRALFTEEGARRAGDAPLKPSSLKRVPEGRVMLRLSPLWEEGARRAGDAPLKPSSLKRVPERAGDG